MGECFLLFSFNLFNYLLKGVCFPEDNSETSDYSIEKSTLDYEQRSTSESH